MINLEGYTETTVDIDTLFYNLDQEALTLIDEDFDLSFIEHMTWGRYLNIKTNVVHYQEEDYARERVQFDWEDWSFEVDVYIYTHDCPTCQCADYSAAIRERLRELQWELT